MSTISAGLVNATNLTVTGASAGAVSATNFKFTNLDVSGTVTSGSVYTNGNVHSSTLDVSGSAIFNGGLVTPGKIRSQTLDVSGNVAIYGNITNPKLTSLSLLQQNTVLPDQSVYSFPNNPIAVNVALPVYDTVVDVPLGIFTNSSKTTISPEFLSSYPETNCISGKVYYYDTEGTSSGPVDGTAGNPRYSGVRGNIGTPIFIDPTDTSAYKVALAKTYRNAPVITDLSGNLVGGALTSLSYSTYADQYGYTQAGMVNTIDQVERYFTKRCWPIHCPPYIALDISNNQCHKNFFYQTYEYRTTGIEFMYTTSQVVPSSINLAFFTFNYDPYVLYGILPGLGLFDLGPKAIADVSPSVRRPVNIPITQDQVVFGNAVNNGTNSVYYDINKKVMSINFVVQDVWNYNIDSSAFKYTSAVTNKMNSFTGSFAVVKKGLGTFVNNGYTVKNTVSCSPSDPNSFLIQVSPQVVMVSETIWNGSSLFGVTTYTSNLTDTNNGEYIGYSLTRPGNGSNGRMVSALPYNVGNSNANLLYPSQTPATSLKKYRGSNPYSTFYESTSNPTNTIDYTFKFFGYVFCDLNFDIWNTTPESMKVVDSSFAKVITDPSRIDRTIHLHETCHSQETSIGSIWFGNSEGHATCIELDSPLFRGGVGIASRMHRQFSAYLNTHYKGWMPFTQGALNYTNNAYSANNLGILGQTYQVGTVYITSNIYGEGVAYRYFSEQYDKNQQIIKRSNEIAIANGAKQVTSNGFTCLYDQILPNCQNAKFNYAQALWEVTSANGSSKEIGLGYSEYALSSVFLRNNTAIPLQYRYLYPLWITNATSPISSAIAGIYNLVSGVYPLPENFCMWSDIDGTIPIYTEKYLTRPSSTAQFGWLDAETLVPFWPRAATGENKYKLGSWKRDASRYLLDASNNRIYPGAFRNPIAGQPVWTPSATAYATSDLVYLEDLATRSYVLPVAGTSGMGVSSVMSSIKVRVYRGNFKFAIAQYVPDSSGIGSWTQLPSTGNFQTIDNPGIWNDASGEVYTNDLGNSVQTSFLDASGGYQEYTFDLSGLSVQTYNGVKYYPKLVCVNAGLYDFGEYLNIFPARCRYTGKVLITPTFV